jgi:hypothetical protein
MPPAQAAALLIVPSTLTNLWQLAAGGHLRALMRRLGPMLLMIFVGTLLGSAGWASTVAPGRARLGGALVVYALYGLIGPACAWPRPRALAGPLCGLVTGWSRRHRGVRDACRALPAEPRPEPRRDDPGLGLSFTVSTLALAGLAGQEVLDGQALGASLLVLAPALLGMLAGTWLRSVSVRAVQALLLHRPGVARRAPADQRLAEEALSMSIIWISKSRSRYSMRFSKNSAMCGRAECTSSAALSAHTSKNTNRLGSSLSRSMWYSMQPGSWRLGST